MKVYVPVIDIEVSRQAFTNLEEANKHADSMLKTELLERPYLEKYSREELVDILEFELMESDRQLPNLIGKL